MERLLKRALAAGLDRRAPECPDTEVLAAFADGSLGRRERTAIESHAASCAGCQAQLAVLARTAPAGVNGAGVSWRWMLLPVATAASVMFAVWLARPYQAPAGMETAPKPLMVASRTGLPPDVAARVREPDADRAPVESRTAEAPIAPRSPSPARADVAGAGASASTARPDAKRERAAEPRQRAPVAAAPAGPAEPVRISEPGLQRQAATDEMRRRAAPSRTIAATEKPAVAGAAPPQAALREAPAPPTSVLAADSLAAPARAIVIESPDSPVRWRIERTGQVRRTADAGASWTAPARLDGEPLAASSPSPLVCWITGRRGAVWRTEDGVTWTAVTRPTLRDLVRVTAANARLATVESDDGTTFTTDDGGKTWRTSKR
jgi:hypothetical protein